MIVTINTDASWSPRQKVAGFAFWIVSNSGKIAKSGMLKDKTDSPDEAEFKCILNALFSLFSSEWKSIGKIIVNTDSLNSIHVFNRNIDKINRYDLHNLNLKFYSEYLRLRDQFRYQSIEIEFRHVKAHKSTSSKREWVNNWCDTEAKRHLANWHQKNNLKQKQ